MDEHAYPKEMAPACSRPEIQHNGRGRLPQTLVRYTDTRVEAPVPGHPGAAPRRARITLITCTPVTLAFTPWRIVVTGDLTRVSARH